MPSVHQKAVNPAQGDFPFNEGIIPMKALTDIDIRRFVEFADAGNTGKGGSPTLEADDVGFYVKPVPSTPENLTATGAGRIAGVSYEEVKYPPHASTGSGVNPGSDTFRIIDPGTRLRDIAIHTGGIIAVEKETHATGKAFTIGQDVFVGEDGKANNTRTNTAPKVGWAFRKADF